jgi:hypothetical protein
MTTNMTSWLLMYHSMMMQTLHQHAAAAAPLACAQAPNVKPNSLPQATLSAGNRHY